MPRSAPLRPLLITLSALGAASGARAEDAASASSTPTFASGTNAPSILAPDAKAISPTVSRAQFVIALGEQVGFVAALRSWRETLRGSGRAPRRELWGDSLTGGRMALAVGQVRAPDLAGFDAGAGTAFSWQGKGGQSFDAGTTARPEQLDALLRHFDDQARGAPAIRTETPSGCADVTWLRAKPVSNGEAELETTLLRAARDGQQGAGGHPQDGTFADVNARLTLPSGWQLRGSWSNARFDGQSARSSWNAGASGVLPHPWGTANVKLDWKTTDAGFATFSGQNAAGENAGGVQISQNIQTPLVSGKLVAAASTRSLEETGAARADDELARDSAQTNADLKLQLAPNLALSATGNASQVEVGRASAGAASPRESLRVAGGDVGMDWKVSKQLSLGAGAGSSQTQGEDAAGAHQSLENRATLRLRFVRAKEDYALALQMRDRDGTGQDPSAPWAHLAALQLETERPLVGDWRLKASANWMIDRKARAGDARGVARQIVAGLQFARAARLDVRLRDGAALPSDLRNDPLGAVFSSSGFTQGNREIATRFNIGSAAGSSGLGLAIEWARQGATSSRNDSWKIGLTYR